MQQEGLLSGEEEHKEKSINLLTYIVVSVIDPAYYTFFDSHYWKSLILVS